MNAKTLEAVKRHGESLLRAFPNVTEKDPVTLCKKLRRIETAIEPILLRNCNEGVPEDELDHATSLAKIRAGTLLGLDQHEIESTGLHVNRDPRGYALKLSSEWTAEHNAKQRATGGIPIYTDMGGYGILAPDLTK